MSKVDLENRPGNVPDEDWEPGKHSGNDWLRDAYNAPSATDDDLPPNHPDRTKSAPDLGAVADQETGTFPTIRQQNGEEEKESSALSDRLGRGYKQGNKSSKGLRGWMTRKRAAITVTTLVLGGGGLGLGSILLGPLELMHLGQVLSKFSVGTSSAISHRTNGFLASTRAARTGDIGETRVGYLGSRRFHNVEAQLKEIGIEFDRSSSSSQATGKPTAKTIDISKHPDFRGMSRQQATSAIAKTYGIPESAVQRIGTGADVNSHKFAINLRDMKSSAVNSLTHTSLEALQDGKVATAMNKRVLTKFFNTPSLFHPIKRIIADIENRMYVRSERLARERERKQSTRRAKLKAKYSTAKATIAEKIEPHRTAINAALIGAAGICFAKSIADTIPLLNYGEIVVPAALEAVDKQAVDSQIRSMQDFKLDQLGDTKASLIDDEGRSVWEGKALNALATNTAGQGQDLDAGYKQAFSEAATKDGILGTLDSVGSLKVGPIDLSGFACSTPGLIIQGGVGLGLLALGPGGWAAKAASVGTSAAATAGVMHFVQDFFIDNLREEAVEHYAGPVGGNLLAHGARAAENMAARSMGSIALSEREEQALLRKQEEQEKNRLRQQSLFARLFSPTEPRSLLSSFALSIKTSQPGVLSRAATSLLNPLKTLSSIFAKLSPKTIAQEEDTYEWGFPLYGIPRDLLENPDYEDPYENAEIMAGLLNEDSGQKYIEKARTCFGVEIVRGSDGWGVNKIEEVNPVEDAYRDADCDNINDPNWARTILFVFDTSLVTIIECYEGNEALCREVGFGGTATAPTPTAGASNPSEDTANMQCPEGTEDGGVHQDYGPGKIPTARIRICGIPGAIPKESGVNASAAAQALAMIEAMRRDGLNPSGSAFRSYERQEELRRQNCRGNRCSPPTAPPGNSMHEVGLAIDFSNMCYPRSTCTPGTNSRYDWLVANAVNYGFKKLSSEAWHWSTTGK